MLVIVPVVIDVAERIERDRIALVVFDRLLEILRGALGVAAVAVSEPAVEIGLGVFRVELDRLVEIGDGAVGVAFGAGALPRSA